MKNPRSVWKECGLAFLLFSTLSWVIFAETPKAYGVKIEFNLRVKMRDSVELSADVFRPDSAGRFPVILLRTPYVKTSQFKSGRFWAEHGYVFVAMDVRGRGDSDGRFYPYRNDGIDGVDSIEWCAIQPWSSGKVGTLGGSYLGRIQWLTAVQQPPHLTAMAVMVTPSDPFVEWPTGTMLPMDISWYHFTAGHVSQNMEAVDWSQVHRHLPIDSMDEAAGRPSPYWKDFCGHNPADPWWEPLTYQNKYERVKVPVLHISGWYDDEQVGTPLNFIGMTRQGPESVRSSQKLLMGPWPHAVNSTAKLGEVDFGPKAVIDLNGYLLRWFDHWLKDQDTGIMKEPPVRIFVMGENRWVEEKEWPMSRTNWARYYLHSRGRANSLFGDGTLSSPPPAQEPADSIFSDPDSPVPFITEPSFAQIGSTDDYRPVQRRDDVLVFTGEPLAKALTVCGPVRAELWGSSTARDTDFMAMLIDVWPNGYAQRLCDGMVRARFRDGMDKPALMKPGQIYRFSVDLWNTCQTFQTGHRIRIQISSSAFPKYDRNLQTGESLSQGVRMVTATNRLFHDRKHPSHVILPVIPEDKTKAPSN